MERPSLIECPRQMWSNYNDISEFIHDWKNFFNKISANYCYEILTQKYRDACEQFIPIRTTPVKEGRHPDITPEVLLAVKLKRDA